MDTPGAAGDGLGPPPPQIDALFQGRGYYMRQATGYSGNLDFMTEENSYLVPYKMTKVGEGSAPYPATSRWANPDVDEAARLMRRVFEHPEEARGKAARARQEIESLHTRGQGEVRGRTPEHHPQEVRCHVVKEGIFQGTRL